MGILEAIQGDCNRAQGLTRNYHMESRVFLSGPIFEVFSDCQGGFGAARGVF